VEGGLMFCLCFIFILFLIFNDSVRPIISTSPGSILTKFAGLVELRLDMNDLKLICRSLKERCHGKQFCGPPDQIQALSTELGLPAIR